VPRPSHVRDAVKQRVLERGHHGWAIDELKDDLDAAGVPADYSSVFRALVWLERLGIAQRVDLGDGKARYEASGAHHEHVQCERCGDVAIVSGCVIEGAAEAIEKSTGFVIQEHRVVLLGLCPACQAG
jgi:Fur family ferric uptake transcriptional regulator